MKESIFKVTWCILETPYGDSEPAWVSKEAFRKTKGQADDLSRKLYNDYHQLGFKAKLTVTVTEVEIL